MEGAVGIRHWRGELAGGEDSLANGFVERGLAVEHAADALLWIQNANRLLQVCHHQVTEASRSESPLTTTAIS